MTEIRIDTDITESLETGRNGCFPIQALLLTRYDNGKVAIDGIGKSGKTLNGGFIVPEQVLVDLCGQYLESVSH